VYGKWLDDEMRNGYPGVEIVREGILPEQRSMIAYLSKFHARFSGRREGETVAEAEKRIRNAINARLKSGRMDRISLGRYFQEAEKKAHAIERERHKQTELACESGPVDTDTVTGTGWKPHSLRTGSGEDFEQLSLFRYRQGVHQA